MPMTLRERMTAFMRGQPTDRIPLAQYDTILPWREAWALVGRENLGLLRWVPCYRSAHPHCRFDTVPFERDGLRRVTSFLLDAGRVRNLRFAREQS